MESDPLSRLTIPADKKRARTVAGWLPLGTVLIVVVGLLLAVWLTRHPARPDKPPSPILLSSPVPDRTNPPSTTESSAPNRPAALLTASGYIVPRERIELSAKFPGTVASVRVRKGDAVKKGDILVTLVDDEHRSLVKEARGRVALAQASLAHAEATYRRQQELLRTRSATDQALDDARRDLDAAQAELLVAQGQLELAETKLVWCTLYAPLDGIILEKMVDENELIIPQGFGLARGPSTTLLAMADLENLQVEIDLNQMDTPKVHLNQPCRITPEAYPDKTYRGQVAEIAPEANRQKGTLQVKVRIERPDSLLVPELTARVDFLPFEEQPDSAHQGTPP